MDLFRQLRDKLSGLDHVLEKSGMLLSIRKGLTLIIPFLLIGSFALIITSLPVPAYQNAMTSVFGAHWKYIFFAIYSGTFGILSVIMVMTVSYCYAGEYSNDGQVYVNPMIAAVVSLCSLLTLSGFGSGHFSLSSFGVTGLFSAIIVAALSAKTFIGLSRLKRLHVRAFTDGANAAFNDAVSAIVPALITISLFAAAGFALYSLFGIRDIQQLISGIFTSLFHMLGYSLWSALLFILLIHIFWVFGIHGNNVLEPVAQSIFVPALASNQQLISHNLAPMNIFTKTFFDTFVLLGGCGSTLCLVLAIFITARHKNLRRHAKLSLVPVLFNVNELIVFGIPIVLNPVYLIPFILTPLLLTLIAFAATAAGLVPCTTHMVEWTTPILLGGYAATGSVAGPILQLVNLAAGTLCFIPFVRMAEHRTKQRMHRTLTRIDEAVESAKNHPASANLLSRRDDIGMTARVLAADLEHDIARGRLSIFYQPQVDESGKITGVEALLRWKHDLYGYVQPPTAIALAEEAHFFKKLDAWIMDTSCSQMRVLMNEGFTGITMSINTTAPQLESDALIGNLKTAIRRYSIPPELLKIEITEKDALTATRKTELQMNGIRSLGVQLAMDDFGMGHSSLMYLKEYKFDTVKIDGSLIKELMTNPACGDIISSIITLGKSLSFSVIAEYVETAEQRDKLRSLGCCQYQGYLYSKALSLDELVYFISNRQRM